MRLFCALLLLTTGRAVAGIENPTCEQVRPGVYRIDYQASPDAGAVQVFASSRPDRMDSLLPAFIIRQTPAEVSLPERSSRVYFHLRPASGPPRVVSIRRLPLEGAANFRDLGGYRASDGRYVRWGLVYRSGHLANLTASDFGYLDGLGIRLVCDVRTVGERARLPTRWMGRAPEFLAAPIGRERKASFTAEDLQRQLDARSGYGQYALDYAPQYGAILRRLAAGDLPALEHCSSGKDRTGVFAAILLTALGVPREAVTQDYLLTTSYLLAPDRIDSTTADVQIMLGFSQPPDRSAVQSLMTTKPERLESTFDDITRAYGSFDAYVRNGMGIADSERALLRQRLLEP